MYASCATLSHTQKYRISIDRERWHLTVLFAMPTAVALSQWIGVLGCGCPNSLSIMQKFIPSLQFKKRAPSSASAADATTKRRIAHNVKNAPFRRMGSPSLGGDLVKKWPQARLWTSDSDKYDASEGTFMTISDTRYRMVASGCVAR